MSYLSLGDKNEEEGDFFGSPVGSSSGRLGSLFGMNAQMANSAGSNQSLTYTAPKPPKPAKQETAEKKAQPASSGVAVAVAVTAYRYVNNQYAKQGKLGAALLSNFAEKDYKILMYVSKQQPVTTAAISSQFQFNIQPNNYASFYDDQRQMWSVMFDTSDQMVKFAKQICLAKFNCGDLSQVSSQDLAAGEQQTQALESGDSVEAKYTGWLVDTSNGTLGTVFDSNHGTEKTFRFKVGKGKVIKGWDQGMLGMKKGGKRFLVIPPSLAYGSKGAGNRVPANSSLAFEVDVLRIKHAQEATAQGVSPAETSPALPNMNEPVSSPTEVQSLAPAQGDETVKGRTASFNEQLAKVPAGKAKLVSRMAKMGQAMFPQQPSGPVTQELDPSHADNSLQQAVMHSEPARPPVPQRHEPVGVGQAQAPASPAHSQSPFAVVEQPYMHNPHAMPYQRPVPMHAPVMMTATGMEGMPVAGMPSQYHSSPSATPFAVNIPTYQSSYGTPQHYAMAGGPELLPLILTESREQSSGLKVLLNKIEKVSEKVDRIKQSPRNSAGMEGTSGLSMDTAMLSHTIQRIVQENDRMKAQVLEKDKLIETQSDKIADLLQKNQKHVEDSHLLMEKRNVSFKETFGQTQVRTLQLEQEKTDLIAKLSESTSKICDLQLKLADATELANSLKNTAKMTSTKAESKVEEEHARYQEIEQQLQDAQSSLREERSKRRELEGAQQEKVEKTTADMQQKMAQMRREFESEKAKLLQEQNSLKEAYEKRLVSFKSQAQGTVQNLQEARGELEAAWKTKCRDAVATVSKAAETKISEINSEKDELTGKVENLQKKYENLRQQATSMKEKYETKIQELVEKSENAAATLNGKQDTTGQVKNIMNTVFQEVRSKISTDDEYSGSDVLSIILNVIKSTTLKLINTDADSGEPSEEDSGEESEDDDESGEDEEESGSGESGDESIEENKEQKGGEDAKEQQPSTGAQSMEGETAEGEASDYSTDALKGVSSGNVHKPPGMKADEPLEDAPPGEAQSMDGKTANDGASDHLTDPLKGASSDNAHKPACVEADDRSFESLPDGGSGATSESSQQPPGAEYLQTEIPTPGEAASQEDTTTDVKETESSTPGPKDGGPTTDSECHPESSKSDSNEKPASEGSLQDEIAEEMPDSDEKLRVADRQEKEHSISPSSDTRSQPPPLFDDDEDSEDDDWLK